LSRPYGSTPTVGAAQVTSRPYSDICRGGWAAGAEDAHCRGAPNPSRPYSKNVPVPAVRIWRSDRKATTNVGNQHFRTCKASDLMYRKNYVSKEEWDN